MEETQIKPSEEVQNVVPRHVVLFPDGNRRWAKGKGLDTLEGHKAGYENLIRFCNWCKARGIKGITAFGFSTENWNRSEREVQYLMQLLEHALRENFSDQGRVNEARKLGLQVRIIGQKDRLPESLREVILKVEEETKENHEMFLNLGISYGGRWDIAEAARKMIRDGISAEAVNEDLFAQYLSTAGQPFPDLVIRAGGERRFSNFVLWQAAYAELYFHPKYWPDFTEQDFDEILEDFNQRQRRFGK